MFCIKNFIGTTLGEDLSTVKVLEPPPPSHTHTHTYAPRWFLLRTVLRWWSKFFFFFFFLYGFAVFTSRRFLLCLALLLVCLFCMRYFLSFSLPLAIMGWHCRFWLWYSLDFSFNFYDRSFYGSAFRVTQLVDFYVTSLEQRNEPSYEIMVLFILQKLVLQTRMHSYPVGLEVWNLSDPSSCFHTSCVRTSKALAMSLGLRWSTMW